MLFGLFTSRGLEMRIENVITCWILTIMWWIKPRVNKMITWWGIWWSWDRQNLTWSSKSSSRDHFIVTETRGPWKKKAISTDACEQWYNYPAGRSLIFLPAIKKWGRKEEAGFSCRLRSNMRCQNCSLDNDYSANN